MSTITGQRANTVVYGWLWLPSNILNGTLQTVSDGYGTGSPLQLSTGNVNITSGFQYSGRNISFAGAFSTSGAFSVVLTATANSNITLPVTGTLSTLAGTETLTNKTLTSPTINNPTISGSGGTLTFPAGPETIVGAATTNTLTNKTIDSATNTIKFNGVNSSTVTGTGAVVLNNTPTLITPVLGVARATSVNKVAITQPANGSTLTLADGVTFTVNSNITLNSPSITRIAKQVFTTSGTYTPTTGMIQCVIEAQGAGGGGGGFTGAGSNSAAAGGGGGGAYSQALFSAAAIGSSQTVTVAAAANGGSAGGTGSTGGLSSVGSLITANGGVGGAGATATVTTQVIAGGAGGAAGSISGASAPIMTLAGRNGGWAQSYGSATGAMLAGKGGDAIYGIGGGQTNLTANSGSGYGAGGSGAAGTTSSAGGGVGSAGIVIITEYIAA